MEKGKEAGASAPPLPPQLPEPGTTVEMYLAAILHEVRTINMSLASKSVTTQGPEVQVREPRRARV